MIPRALSRLAAAGFWLSLAGCGMPATSPSQLASSKNSKEIRAYETRSERLKMADGIELAASLYLPDPAIFPGKRPVIVFASSWVLNEWEYDSQAKEFTKDGYIALSYAPRGFSTSGGTVDVASPLDVKDISTIIDWLGANTPADTNRVALAGVSYGAGLSLLGAANDDRVKAVVALSGWGDLNKSLAPNDSVRQVWISLLIGSGALLGRLDQDVYARVDDLFHHRNVEALRAWARERSAINYVDKINARQVPIFVGNSYQDNLFPPGQMQEFYEKLTGPKMFYMDRGVHAMSSIPGLLGLPSEVWLDAHQWIDHWLLGKESEIMHRPPVSFGTDMAREYYPNVPRASSAESAVLKLTTLNNLYEKASAAESTAPNIVIRLIGDIDSFASSGIPLLSDTTDALLRLPVYLPINFIDSNYAAIYVSQPMNNLARLRGAPRVTIHLQPHNGPVQLVAYLYDVDSYNIGRLVTHGVFTRYEPNPAPSTVNLDLQIAAYDIPAGHHIVVAIDTRDPLYIDPSPGVYQLEIDHSEHAETSVTLPLIN